MRKTLSTALVAGSLSLSGQSVLAQQENNDAHNIEATPFSEEVKNRTIRALEGKEKQLASPETKEEVRALLLGALKNHPNISLNKEEEAKLTELLSDEGFLEGIFNLIKKHKIWSPGSLILALALGIGYAYAYGGQIRAIVRDKLPINVRSFATFGGISGLMAILNGFVPGSLVYAESFILALTSVGLHKRNLKNGAQYKNSDLFKTFASQVSMPVAQYDESNFPVIWNEQMEIQTGYTHEEIKAYYNEEIEDEHGIKQKRGEVMSLLYKGKNLERVHQYLSHINISGEGYTDIAFSMNTKGGEEKTFHWSTYPDGNGGTIRIIKHLTDLREIKIELEKQRELLRKDPLTGAYSRGSLDEDLRDMCTNKERREDAKNVILAMIDLDNFKHINDTYGHGHGDFLLREFVSFIEERIRPEDKLYRYGGDEFILMIQSSEFETIIEKLNALRHDFFKIQLEKDTIPFSEIGTSWGVITFNTQELRKDVTEENIDTIAEKLHSEADRYMYAVKHYSFLENDLLANGRIGVGQSAKNGIGVPVYTKEGVLEGVQIINEHGQFVLSTSELLRMKIFKGTTGTR